VKKQAMLLIKITFKRDAVGKLQYILTCNEEHVLGFHIHLKASSLKWLMCHFPSSLSPQNLPVTILDYPEKG